jgi:hypothetical protein
MSMICFELIVHLLIDLEMALCRTSSEMNPTWEFLERMVVSLLCYLKHIFFGMTCEEWRLRAFGELLTLRICRPFSI